MRKMSRWDKNFIDVQFRFCVSTTSFHFLHLSFSRLPTTPKGGLFKQRMSTGGDVQWLEGVLLGAVEWSATVPGLSWIVNYVAHSLHRDPWRLFLEILMVAVLLRYLFGKRYRPKDKTVKLTEREVEELVQEWQPEPLVPPLSRRAKREAESIPVIEGPSGAVVKVGGQHKINLASFNFLGLVGDQRIEVSLLLPLLPLRAPVN